MKTFLKLNVKKKQPLKSQLNFLNGKKPII